jgi:hypothetical protein
LHTNEESVRTWSEVMSRWRSPMRRKQNKLSTRKMFSNFHVSENLRPLPPIRTPSHASTRTSTYLYPHLYLRLLSLLSNTAS